MKIKYIYIIAFVIILFSVSRTYSQTINITYSTPVCQGSSTQFYGTATAVTATSFNFNTGGLPSGWSSTAYTVGQPCNAVPGNTPDNSNYFWAADVSGARWVQTSAVDVTYGGNLNFLIRYGNDDPEPGCEQVDSGEHVVVQFSNPSYNSGAWTDIIALTTLNYTWQSRSVAIPNNAKSSNTSFRWIQNTSSGIGFDNWGLDDISVNRVPNVLSWSWNFGDGETSSAQNPAHTYTTSGNKNVTLNVVFEGSVNGSDAETVYVNPKPATPTLTLSPDEVCQEATQFALSGGSPTTGGVYSGTGVSSNLFYPAIAGSGNHTISYRVSSAGCWSDAITDVMTVNPTPTVTFGTVTPNPVHLWQGATLGGGTPAGGTYSGTGVSGTSFTPSVIGATGNYPLAYTYVDANTCTATANYTVSVIDNSPTLNLNQSPVPDYYMLTSPVVLFPDATITDSDGGDINWITILINPMANTGTDNDEFYFTNTTNITGSIDSNGWLALIGPASVSEFQQALRLVSYANIGTAFPEVTRTIQVTITPTTSAQAQQFGQVNIIPNQRPVAVNDSYDVYEDNYILSVAADGVLSNDYDPDAFDVIHAVLNTNPAHHASFNLNANGSFTYEPVDGFVGTDSFTYYANDTKVNSLTPATVTIHVLHPTWDGTGDWSDASKWNGTIDPSEALDSVLINNGTVTIGTANAEVRVITLTSNGHFQVQNGYYLQIDDALRNNMRRVVSLNSPMQVKTSIEIPMDNSPVKGDTDMICVSESSMLHINGTYFLDTDGIFKKDASRIGYRNGQWEIWDERVNSG
ncbi:MAG: hypothetical protein C0593_10540, partial [Marinilabiliales bacterium]